MSKELVRIDFWVSGPNFDGYHVMAFHIFEAAAIAIRENKPQSIGAAVHAWGGGIERSDFMLLSVVHLIKNYNLGNNYVDNKKQPIVVKSLPWYKKIFK